MTHASLREDSNTIHHITSTTGITGILATAGLLAEAINYRHGHDVSDGDALSLSVVSDDASPGKLHVTEFTIRCVGSFWLANE